MLYAVPYPWWQVPNAPIKPTTALNSRVGVFDGIPAMQIMLCNASVSGNLSLVDSRWQAWVWEANPYIRAMYNLPMPAQPLHQCWFPYCLILWIRNRWNFPDTTRSRKSYKDKMKELPGDIPLQRFGWYGIIDQNDQNHHWQSNTWFYLWLQCRIEIQNIRIEFVLLKAVRTMTFYNSTTRCWLYLCKQAFFSIRDGPDPAL